MKKDPAKKLLHCINTFLFFSWLGSCSVGTYQLKLNLVLLGTFLAFLFVLGSMLYSRWEDL